jgi:alkanesulfonate monooxygenase
MNFRIHWALPVEIEKQFVSETHRIGVPQFDFMLSFCLAAERAGIDSLLVPFGFHTPDPLTLVAALCTHAKRMRFMIAYRSGLQSPTLFAQQVNTLSVLSGGRVSLNMVAGISPEEQGYYGDFERHDGRYERADEFLDICRQLWRGAEVDFEGKYYRIAKGRILTPYVGAPAGPEIYIGGNSVTARDLARRHGSCWLRYADTPAAVAESASALRESGLEVGLRLSVVVRRSEAEALAAASAVIEVKDESWKNFVRDFVGKCDSVAVKSTFALAQRTPSDWLTPSLWTGAVPFRGGPGMALVGTPQTIVDAIAEYAACGVSQFIFSGWPNVSELENFGALVMPRLAGLRAGAREPVSPEKGQQAPRASSVRTHDETA